MGKIKNKEELRIENIDIFKRERAIDDFFYVCSYENALAMANLFEKINYYLATGTPVSPHFLLERHIKEVIGMNNIKFCKKRMEDYDLSRRFGIRCNYINYLSNFKIMRVLIFYFM